jgi:hypothetical protein
MIGIKNNEPVLVPFTEAIRTDKGVNQQLTKVLHQLSI